MFGNVSVSGPSGIIDISLVSESVSADFVEWPEEEDLALPPEPISSQTRSQSSLAAC